MEVGKMLFLLVVSLCASALVVEAESDISLAMAQETLLSSGIAVDLESSHIEDLKSHSELPAAYKKVIESLLLEAETCETDEKYRRADGVCNNLNKPLYGAVLHYQTRLLPNAYMDGVNVPRIVGKNNNYLASARTVSLGCFPANEENKAHFDKRTVQMSMQWGQYIDHDVVFTEVMPGSGCCDDPRHTCLHQDTFSGGPCFPIDIPPGDRFFNESCMNFKRSFSIDVDGVHQQISGVTAFVDASTVYGSSQAHQDSLRTKYKGLLKVSDYNMLPNTGHFKCMKHLVQKETCPFAGDARVNVFPGLTLLHLMFVREHNRLATNLAELNPHWTDEKIFQETRRIIIAMHQKITYDDYLPHVIGEEAMDFFKLRSETFEYDPSVNPSILNEFAVAAFRFGHSQINGLLHNKGKKDISELYFRPWTAQKSESSIKKIVKEQCKRLAQETNQFFTRAVTDKLFMGVDAPGHSTDLAARNVQRGRDHGVRPYNEYLDLAISSFLRAANSSYDTFKEPECLSEKNVYDSLFDVDLFVGGLYEEPMPGALVGPTFAYIIGEQFRRLKFGDRFFYLTDDPSVGFTPDQLSEVRKLSLPHVICRNTDNWSLQPDVFRTPKAQSNKAIKCTQYKDIDLSAWKEDPPLNLTNPEP